MAEKESLYMETTKKEPEETAAEIQKVLKKHGLKKFMFDYEDGEMTGCIFTIQYHDKEIPIRLPIKWEPLWVMAQRGETKYAKTLEQVKRVAWRQVLRWIESQLALVELDMVEMTEVFLPYIMINPKTTMYQKFVKDGPKLLGFDE
jgi:hypothetical protein